MVNTNEYMAAYMNRRRKTRRAQLIELLGGICLDCGTDQRLEFDHRIPGSQEFRINTRALDKPWPVILAEVAKCDLRCNPCHRVKTARLREDGSVDHGGGASGKKNCPCTPCKTRKAEYMKVYMEAYTRPNRSSVAQSVAALDC